MLWRDLEGIAKISDIPGYRLTLQEAHQYERSYANNYKLVFETPAHRFNTNNQCLRCFQHVEQRYSKYHAFECLPPACLIVASSEKQRFQESIHFNSYGFIWPEIRIYTLKRTEFHLLLT